MQSKNTRIAYLKRMLRRLDSEDARLNQLVSAGALTAEAARLGGQQLAVSRERLLAELQSLEAEEVPHNA